MLDGDQSQMFAQHWVKAQPVVQTFLLSIVRTPADVDDVLQSTALKAARMITRYDPTRPFIPWAMTIARNEALDHLRRAGRDRLVFDADIVDQLADDAERLTQEMTERKAALEHCVGDLPDRSRRLVTWRYGDGLSIEAISGRERMKPNAIYVALHRVRETLARCIELRIGEGG